MTLDDIRQRLAAIDAAAGSDEIAHGLEDTLHEDFIRYVAETATEPLASMASEVLKAADIEFARLYA